MEKNIVVPDFVVDAIMADLLVVAACDGRGVSLTEPVAREVARRVCVALSENPIVPTTAETFALLQERVKSGNLSSDDYNSIPATTIRCVIREWQRRMFLAPEPEIRTFVTHGWNGGAK